MSLTVASPVTAIANTAIQVGGIPTTASNLANAAQLASRTAVFGTQIAVAESIVPARNATANVIVQTAGPAGPYLQSAYEVALAGQEAAGNAASFTAPLRSTALQAAAMLAAPVAITLGAATTAVGPMKQAVDTTVEAFRPMVEVTAQVTAPIVSSGGAMLEATRTLGTSLVEAMNPLIRALFLSVEMFRTAAQPLVGPLLASAETMATVATPFLTASLGLAAMTTPLSDAARRSAEAFFAALRPFLQAVTTPLQYIDVLLVLSQSLTAGLPIPFDLTVQVMRQFRLVGIDGRLENAVTQTERELRAANSVAAGLLLQALALLVLEITLGTNLTRPRAHLGLYTKYLGIEDILQKRYRAGAGGRRCIGTAGFSTGGVLASYATAGLDLHTCVTFGAPAAGNAAFVEEVDVQTTRYVLDSDRVPSYPPSIPVVAEYVQPQRRVITIAAPSQPHADRLEAYIASLP